MISVADLSMLTARAILTAAGDASTTAAETNAKRTENFMIPCVEKSLILTV
jgi:hypothetical protein